MQDCGCSIVGLPRNTTICTLEQLLNLGQLLVGVLQSEDFARLWLNFEMAASQSVKEALLHAHKTDLSLLSLEEGGDPFLPQHAEFVWPHTLQAVTEYCECFWYRAKSKIWFQLDVTYLLSFYPLHSKFTLNGRNHFNPLGIRGHIKPQLRDLFIHSLLHWAI